MTEPLTEKSMAMTLRNLAYSMHITPVSRHRMSKEIAEELIAEMGDKAYFYCIEKLATNTQNPLMWRDVLTYLDEMEGKDGHRGMDTNKSEREGEQPQGERDDSEDSHKTSR